MSTWRWYWVCISKWKPSTPNSQILRAFHSIILRQKDILINFRKTVSYWNKSYIIESIKNSIYLNSPFPEQASKWSLLSLSDYYIPGTEKGSWEQRWIYVTAVFKNLEETVQIITNQCKIWKSVGKRRSRGADTGAKP